jgi:crotonobetainyl-CoA:carnitine CoA-transferase CaiB-like acyl-CoA transferase
MRDDDEGWCVTFDQTLPGLKVLDLSTNIAGPFAAMILGDMGADVIKIERPPHGDDTRALPPQVDGQATVFNAVNRNKRSLLLDIKSLEGKETLFKLAETADVVIESFPPGLGEKLGITFDALKARNPRILIASISAFGDGPIGKTMPGYDALVQAVSGMMSFTGSPGTPTARIAPSVLDLTTGMWAAMGLLAAILRRNAGGGAEHVRPSLIDSAFTLMNHQLLGMLATGKVPEKLGSGAPSAAPYGVFASSDGEFMIATASEPQFPRLCEALGLDDLPADPRFATMTDRLAHRNELNHLIADIVVKQTTAHWLETLGKAGISCGRVNNLAEALALPVVAERALLSGSDLRLPIDPDALGIRRPAPRLGEHSQSILLDSGLTETGSTMNRLSSVERHP